MKEVTIGKYTPEEFEYGMIPDGLYVQCGNLSLRIPFIFYVQDGKKMWYDKGILTEFEIGDYGYNGLESIFGPISDIPDVFSV